MANRSLWLTGIWSRARAMSYWPTPTKRTLHFWLSEIPSGAPDLNCWLPTRCHTFSYLSFFHLIIGSASIPKPPLVRRLTLIFSFERSSSRFPTPSSTTPAS